MNKHKVIFGVRRIVSNYYLKIKLSIHNIIIVAHQSNIEVI